MMRTSRGPGFDKQFACHNATQRPGGFVENTGARRDGLNLRVLFGQVYYGKLSIEANARSMTCCSARRNAADKCFHEPARVPTSAPVFPLPPLFENAISTQHAAFGCAIGYCRATAMTMLPDSNETDTTAATQGGFWVELARSKEEYFIPPSQTILEVLYAAGIDIYFSCEMGVCGACETRVISGVPDHRDCVLSEEERASNTRVMICCAGCKSERLVLDL